MVNAGPALGGYFAFFVYVGIRLGWWAPASARALKASLGECSRFEYWGLIAATIGLPIWAWTAR